MDLQIAIRGTLDAREQLRSKQGTADPAFISEQMTRLSHYIGAVEEGLAELEEQYETDMATKLRKYQLDDNMAASAAENRARMDLGNTKGRIAYLNRIVKSGWKIVGACQSRWNHLNQELNLGKHSV